MCGVPKSKISGMGSRTRWSIVWMMLFSTVRHYISRQRFSVLSPMISAHYLADLAKIIVSLHFRML